MPLSPGATSAREPGAAPGGRRIEGIEVTFRDAVRTSNPRTRYPGFSPGTEVLRRGTVLAKGARPLETDILIEREVAVGLRDGVTIYTDVFRPADAGKYPAIVAWSPFGKRGGALILDDIPFRAGVKKELLSGLEKFEGPDPSYWCARGYAVLNPDPRGVNRSEGDIAFWGRQEGQDGADFIEWAARQEWSNGRVGLTGNSWLAIAQWFIAAERPPHLAAIAPWEGASDLYRDDIFRGGIPDGGFNESIVHALPGDGRIEDVPAMAERYPLMNAYWEDKIPACGAIETPAYVVASWTNTLHTTGTLRAYRKLGSTAKWLRVHNTHEWPDYYDPSNTEDLRKFFDFYLKGIANDWPRTPRVRLSVLDPGGTDVVNRPEAEFPVARTERLALHLDASTKRMSSAAVSAASAARYEISGSRLSQLAFMFTAPHDLELNGYARLRLWVSAEGADDMDLFVQLRKLDRRGRWRFAPVVPLPPIPRFLAQYRYRRGDSAVGLAFFAGPHGRLRVSHRATDPARSTEMEPWRKHTSEERLKPGEIVAIDIPLTPVAMRWHAGEQFQLLIAGYNLNPMPLKGLRPAALCNRGAHVIHCGGQWDSQLILPVLSA